MSITAININYSNGQGGHTATVTEVVGAQDADQTQSLGEVVDDGGQRNSFSHDKIDELMKSFVLEGRNTNVDAVKTTVTRQYIDRTSAKLNNYILLVRGINAPPVGGLEWEGNIPYYGEVKGSFAPSFGQPQTVKEGNSIIVGWIYNFNTRATKDGTKISLVYQSKELSTDLSKGEKVVAAGFMEEPNLGEFSLKYGYTLDQYFSALELANIEYEFPEVEGGESMLFETSGSLASVTASIASHFGLYFYVDPTNQKLKFIDSEEASALSIDDPTQTDDPNVISATYSEKVIPEAILNTYVGTGEKPEPHSPTNNQDPTLFATFFKRVYIEEFQAFKDMHMSWRTMGAFFSLFNQDQPPDIFDKFTLIALVLAERNSDRPQKPLNAQGNAYGPNEVLLKWPVGNPPVFEPLALNVQGNVIRGANQELVDILNPLYLPIPYNTETWKWGPAENPKDTAIWKQTETDQALAEDVRLAGAAQNDKSHEFRRTKKEGGTDKGKVKSAAKYFNVSYEKTLVQRQWEANGRNRITNVQGGGLINNVKNLGGDVEEAKIMAMPKPSESPLYEFLKCFFQIGGGVYVSNGYGRMKSLTMSFDNANNITVSGPHHGNTKLVDIADVEPLNNFFRILGIGRDATVRQLANLTNGEAQVVGNFFFIAIRQLALFEKINDNNAQVNAANAKADYGPLGSLIEWYHKPNDDTGKMHFVGGKIEKEDNFYEYIRELVWNSQTSFVKAIGAVVGGGRAFSRLKCYYQRVEAPIEEEDEDKLVDDDNIVAGGGEEGQKMDLHDKYDSRFYSVVNPVDEDERNTGFMKPSLSAASGTSVEMKALKAARGTAGGMINNLKTSSKTIYGLSIPEEMPELEISKEEGVLYFKPTMSSIAITVGQGGIQTTIAESTLKLIPPDQQFIIGQGIEAMLSNIVSSRFTAGQKNYLGL